MLRLQKGTRQNPIVMTFRERPLVFSRELIQAFGLALGIHILAIILFHISPFRVRNPEIILPPSLVNIEIPKSEGQVITELHEIEPRLRLPPAPRWTSPGLPGIPDSSSFLDNHLASMEPLLKKPFQELRLALPQTAEPAPHSVRVTVSGPLSACEMDSLKMTIPDTVKHERQQFAVKVDTSKGEIFWYEQLEGSKDGRAFAEDILTALRFSPNPKDIVISGEIEIIYD